MSSFPQAVSIHTKEELAYLENYRYILQPKKSLGHSKLAFSMNKTISCANRVGNGVRALIDRKIAISRRRNELDKFLRGSDGKRPEQS